MPKPAVAAKGKDAVVVNAGLRVPVPSFEGAALRRWWSARICGTAGAGGGKRAGSRAGAGGGNDGAGGHGSCGAVYSVEPLAVAGARSQLESLLYELGDSMRGLTAVECGGAPVEVHGVEYDSRRVGRGDVFVAMRGGATDGNRYIDAAISAGCGSGGDGFA